ncbi:MAG TPA: nuclear transport factor 2 family protein [Candidatus Limnocylindria bacterium]
MSGSEALVRRYMAAIPADFATLGELRHPDFVEEWPQSGERIRGHENSRRIHERYPGVATLHGEVRGITGAEDRWVLSPTLAPLRIEGTGDTYTVESIATYPDGSKWFVIAILKLQDGKVLRARTYWAAPFEAPAWRAEWVERMERS